MNIGDTIIMKPRAPYGVTVGGSIGKIISKSGGQIRVCFNNLDEEYGNGIFEVSEEYCTLYIKNTWKGNTNKYNKERG